MGDGDDGGDDDAYALWSRRQLLRKYLSFFGLVSSMPITPITPIISNKAISSTKAMAVTMTNAGDRSSGGAVSLDKGEISIHRKASKCILSCVSNTCYVSGPTCVGGSSIALEERAACNPNPERTHQNA